ncbi:hypothetical protein SLEP1_g35629 [Rubroshorea leprosula]|nr:hypothetical protein SLEP1_g35629 [Rubroshorea leprosula]
MSTLERDWTQVGVRRSISDHCAIILKSRNVDWGPKPFQALDVWQQHPEFRDFVAATWENMRIEGWAAFKCQKKLKLLKEECKRWNNEVFGNVEVRFESVLQQIEKLDKKSEENDLDENEVMLRKECSQEVWDILQKREAVWKQKSRANWACLGDANTTFFHRCVHARQAQNVISGILGEDGWVEEPERVKAEAVRQLVDSVLILNEVVHEVKRRKQQSFMFKADFEKAYDCVDWGFLDWMMDSMGFGDKWRKWIRECLSTARISVLINGSPTKEFSASKGLRQGDPLSPFLFLLVGEGLCGMVKKAECEGLLRGVEIGRGGVVLSLLQFADDTVFIGKADAENVRVVKAILLWCWRHVTLWGGQGAFYILGLASRRNSREEKVLEVSARSVSSKACHLEKPTTVLWRPDYLNKLGDGLDSLWKRVIWGKHYGGRRERDVISAECLNMSRIWKDIVSLDSRSERLSKMLVRGFKWEVGDESCVDFWSDKWVGDKSLKELYLRLFAVAIRTEGSLKDMGVWRGENWVWDCRWRCGCRGRAAEEEEHFRAMINGFQLRIDREDSWRWVHSSDGCYSVKAAYEFLTPTSSFLEEKWAKVIWNRYVPSKGTIWVACFVMRGWSNFIIFYVGVKGYG